MSDLAFGALLSVGGYMLGGDVDSVDYAEYDIPKNEQNLSNNVYEDGIFYGGVKNLQPAPEYFIKSKTIPAEQPDIYANHDLNVEGLEYENNVPWDFKDDRFDNVKVSALPNFRGQDNRKGSNILHISFPKQEVEHFGIVNNNKKINNFFSDIMLERTRVSEKDVQEKAFPSNIGLNLADQQDTILSRIPRIEDLRTKNHKTDVVEHDNVISGKMGTKVPLKLSEFRKKYSSMETELDGNTIMPVIDILKDVVVNKNFNTKKFADTDIEGYSTSDKKNNVVYRQDIITNNKKSDVQNRLSGFRFNVKMPNINGEISPSTHRENTGFQQTRQIFNKVSNVNNSIVNSTMTDFTQRETLRAQNQPVIPKFGKTNIVVKRDIFGDLTTTKKEIIHNLKYGRESIGKNFLLATSGVSTKRNKKEILMPREPLPMPRNNRHYID
jgi:hypothetical protein